MAKISLEISNDVIEKFSMLGDGVNLTNCILDGISLLRWVNSEEKKGRLILSVDKELTDIQQLDTKNIKTEKYVLSESILKDKIEKAFGCKDLESIKKMLKKELDTLCVNNFIPTTNIEPYFSRGCDYFYVVWFNCATKLFLNDCIHSSITKYVKYVFGHYVCFLEKVESAKVGRIATLIGDLIK